MKFDKFEQTQGCHTFKEFRETQGIFKLKKISENLMETQGILIYFITQGNSGKFDFF